MWLLLLDTVCLVLFRDPRILEIFVKTSPSSQIIFTLSLPSVCSVSSVLGWLADERLDKLFVPSDAVARSLHLHSQPRASIVPYYSLSLSSSAANLLCPAVMGSSSVIVLCRAYTCAVVHLSILPNDRLTVAVLSAPG